MAVHGTTVLRRMAGHAALRSPTSTLSAGNGLTMLPQTKPSRDRSLYAQAPRWIVLATMLVVTGCRGASVSGAAGNQVDRMGGTGGSGMDRGDMNHNGGSVYPVGSAC